MVVEVALGVNDVVFLGQHRRNEFFCGGLAIGAGDAEHNGLHLLSMVGRQVLHGF